MSRMTESPPAPSACEPKRSAEGSLDERTGIKSPKITQVLGQLLQRQLESPPARKEMSNERV
jgi:hypothetical protein